jgi:hypothetical protein
MKRGLLVLQFWDGDKRAAMHLARLLADMEPTRRNDIDFVFLARADSTHDSETVEYVSRKFNVRKLRCKTLGTGHPFGCWVLWFTALEWVYTSGEYKNYQWIFPFEADTCPTSKTWINDLHEDFVRLDKNIVGAEWLFGYHHVNGNMMVRCDEPLLKWLVRDLTVAGVPQREPWDVYLFPQFSKWGVGFTQKMYNDYARRTISKDEFEAYNKQGLAFLHGTKDDSARHHARELFIKKIH